MTKKERYSLWIRNIRETKIEHTRQKIAQAGFMNEDDYGTLPLPESFTWKPVSNHPNGSFYGNMAWGENFRSMLEQSPPYADPASAVAGGSYVFLLRLRPDIWNPSYSFDHLKPYHVQYDITSGIGSMHHMCGDVRIGLRLGWDGLLEKIRRYAVKNGDAAKEFYNAEEDVVLGVITWIKNTVAHIDVLITDEEDEELKKNLIETRRVNEKLVHEPPSTLREACQWIIWYNLATRSYNRDGAGGQLDELLRPYYERDLAAGSIDDDDAVYYIASMLAADTHYYQLSGPDENGRDMTSRISYLILEAARSVNVSANLTIRVHDGIDEAFYLKSVEYLIECKNGWPRYSGDNSLVEGFMKNGYSRELARNRIAVGCNWMALPGLEYPLNDCVKINTAKVFETAFDETASEPGISVEKLWRSFEKHMRKAVEVVAQGIDFHLKYQRFNSPELFLNFFMQGPIEKGADISAGTAEMYNMGVDGTGIAVVADSFAALEQRIEKEGRIGWDEITECLRSDYSGMQGERIRQLMLRSERYGHNNSAADAWGLKISSLFTRLVTDSPTPEGRKMIPGWFSWSKTIEFGSTVGATPNGRKAGQPINHNANPLPGFREDAAVTAMANTVASVQCGYGNTVPLQLELDPGITESPQAVKVISALLRTHLEQGGTLINVNIVDADKIRAAHKDPEAFPDLVVRVTGFTAYFMSLSPEFRQLVVDRLVDRSVVA